MTKKSNIIKLDDRERGRIADAAAQKVRAPDGPILSEWDRSELAAAIEAEANRVQHMPFARVTLHMDLADARRLAFVLRYGSSS